jgi:hypothetical protein
MIAAFKHKRRFSLARLIGSSVLLALTFTGIVAYRRLTETPHFVRPPHVLPNPNAYDIYKRISTDIPFGPAMDHRHPEKSTLAEKEKLLAACNDRLLAYRQARHIPYMQPVVTYPTNSNSPDNAYAAFRSFARLLAFEGRVRAGRGDWNGAAQSGVDGLEFGEQIPRGGALVAMLVGFACEQIARKQLWETAQHVDAASAKETARRLETLTAQRFPLTETLKEEKYDQQQLLIQLFDETSLSATRKYLAENEKYARTKEDISQTLRQNLGFQFQIAWHGKKYILDEAGAYQDAISTWAGQPFNPSTPFPTPPSSTEAKHILELSSQIRTKYQDACVQQTMLTAIFALRAHRLEHGRYPDSLTELVKAGYLKRVPEDPFAVPAGPLRYRNQTPDRYVLYSVGPDSKDDNGKPINNPVSDTNPDERRFADWGTTGDFVKGINTY